MTPPSLPGTRDGTLQINTENHPYLSLNSSLPIVLPKGYRLRDGVSGASVLSERRRRREGRGERRCTEPVEVSLQKQADVSERRETAQGAWHSRVK
jgi:hypothetical protein